MFNEALSSSEVVANSVDSLNWLIQALGGIVVIYTVFAIATFIVNWKKNKEISKVREDVEEIKRMLKKRKS